MQDDVTKQYLDQKLKALKNELSEKLDKIIGMIKKFDEEQTLQGGKIIEHGERLEVVEDKLRITS